MEFGYMVKKLRKEKGLTLRGFAKELQKSPSYISNIERGVVPPPSATVVREIAELLVTDAEELLRLANRFDMENFDKIRRNAKRIGVAERSIRFLHGAMSLEENDPLGGITGVFEIITGERILNPDPKILDSNFDTIRFIMDLLSNPDEGNNNLGIKLRREFSQGIFGLVNDTAHPYPNLNPEEKKDFEEILISIFKKYPQEILDEVIKREDFKLIYQEYLEKGND